MAKITDSTNAAQHPTETLRATGTIGALNAEVITACDGRATVALDMRGTFNMTIEVSGTVDGTNWTLIPMRPINVASVTYVASVAGTTAGTWVGICSGFKQVRARCTAYTSGGATAFIAADGPLLSDMMLPALTAVTATGASGAAVTLTVPAPGAGLRQYLNRLLIQRFAVATLTAGAAPVVPTTTNLPGSLAFSIPADAAAQGTIYTEIVDCPMPGLAASAQNTAVTIVCGATTNVIWRVTAIYYIAP